MAILFCRSERKEASAKSLQKDTNGDVLGLDRFIRPAQPQQWSFVELIPWLEGSAPLIHQGIVSGWY